jgi:DGQHR domain-containing protein
VTRFTFMGVRAQQSADHDVFSFAATPEQVLAFSEIERVSRDDKGELKGFQRHQVASHIKEIRHYLERSDALLPNAVIVAFIDGAKVRDVGDGVVKIEVNATRGKPGFVVDGQQRLTALSGLKKPGFQVFVSALICRDYNELRQQFVLINNTRPLPKTLIYELLPTVDGLPERFTARKFSARVVDRLNFQGSGALRGQIRQHTNPTGVISDTAMQKVVANSASNGAIREFIKEEDFEGRAVRLVDEFFNAVAEVFRSEWVGMTPKTSRLRHGAGIVAMGYVMELLYSMEGATTKDEFGVGLKLLKPFTAWTSGIWDLGNGDLRMWNGIQNTPTDIDALTTCLTRSLKKALRKPRRVAIG